MFSSTDWLKWTLLGALGVPLAACGGSTDTDSGEGSGGTSSGGSASGGDTSTGGASTGSGGASGFTCTNPRELPGGFVSCDEGYTHRPGRGECSSERRTERVFEAPEWCTNCCEYDSDCTEEDQYCVVSSGGFSGEESFCITGCLTDSDCDEGYICECGEVRGRCVAAECETNADCAGELGCTPWQKSNGCSTKTTYTCQTGHDECLSASDCGDSEECRPQDGVRRCLPVEYSCAIGRPFLVEGEIRTAPVGPRSDWVTPSRLSVSDLDAATRAALAAHWERAGQMEHASVAAFARFSLQLLALGAPAELVEATTRALADETRHARLCFGVASSYRGYDVGPLALSIDGALSADDLESIVRTAIEEGCVGETVAALEAARSAEEAKDETIRELLLTIAEDEARHAELAYRFVAWVLELHPELRPAVQDEFERALRGASSQGAAWTDSVPNGGRASSEPDLSAYGVLSRRAREEVRRQALREIVGPCWQQLVQGAPASGTRPSSAASPSIAVA